MLSKIGHKVKLYKPKNDQTHQASYDHSSSRFVWNHFLTLRERYYRRYKKGLSFNKQSAHLTKISKRQYSWLSEYCSRTCLTQSLRNLNKSYANFFKNPKKYRYPNYKSRYAYNKSTYQDVKLDIINMRVYLPNIGWLRIRKGYKELIQKITNQPKMMTLTKDNLGDYYISFMVEEDVEPLERSEKSCGLDLNIENFCTLSSGLKIDNGRFLKRKLRHLRISQKSLARKMKGSRRREKQRKRVAKIHKDVLNARLDFHQKTSSELIRMFDYIFIEDLAVKNMMKNRKLARAIQDVGWSSFVNMLSYKAERHGKIVMKIGRFDKTTKICHDCDYVKEDLTLKDREWTCPDCGIVHDRDVNAAKNIEKHGWLRYCRGIAPQDAQGNGLLNMEMDKTFGTCSKGIVDEMFIGNVIVVDETGCRN